MVIVVILFKILVEDAVLSIVLYEESLTSRFGKFSGGGRRGR